MRRIHIVGISPRSGTTLMAELMHACFRLEGGHRHEQSIFEIPDSDGVYCSKKPRDMQKMAFLMRFDPDLWTIAMMRDPRDVIVSRHQNDPGRYWVPLRIWKRRYPSFKRLEQHTRAVRIRYEDLVCEPAKVQKLIEQRMPFLEKKLDFADWYRIATPTQESRTALHGVRPLDQASIGRWHEHKPRVAAQIARHGSISSELQELGYEADNRWADTINNLPPDRSLSHIPEQGQRETFRKRFQNLYAMARYIFLRCTRR